MGLGSVIGRQLAGVREEMQKSSKEKLYFDWMRNDVLARLLQLHVRLAYVANHASFHPIARGDALLMDLELTAPRLEGLKNEGIANWIRKKDKALPFWFEAVSKYERDLRYAKEHPEVYYASFGEPNPVDVARNKLERFYNFWLYPPAKPITELFDKYFHVPEYMAVRELPAQPQNPLASLLGGNVVDQATLDAISQAANKQ